VDPVEHLDGLKRIFEKHYAGPVDYPIEFMALRFMTVRSHAFSSAWPHQKTTKKLEKMKQKFAEIQRIFQELPVLMQSRFDDEAIRLAGRATENQFNFQLVDQEGVPTKDLPPRALEALISGFEVSEFLEIQKRFSQTVENMAEYVPHGMTVGNKNLASWAIVHACSVVCDQFPEKITVPKAMNESGPFYRLLVDMLDHHGEGADPVAAFKGWKKSYG
jgi:hypothetical protein